MITRTFGECVVAALVVAATLSASPAAALADPLPVEEIPSTAELPDKYPASYVLVHDMHSPSLLDARLAVVDTATTERAYKGQIPVGHFGSVLASTTRNEIYVAETFYSRLTRGERTDTISIWDKKTLAPAGEVVLPGGKRGQMVTMPNSLQLTNGEAWALVFNFTPASSVTVVDLDARRILGDIDLPGCSLTYPTGERGFMSLCADGTMTSIALDKAGGIANTVTSKAFNDIDNDPMFMTPAMVGRTAWFTTFKGGFRGIDLSGPVARDLGAFRLPPEKSAAGEWRPGGWQVISASPDGKLYVLMNPAGGEGSHKDGGTEVWVVDPVAKARTARIPLRGHGVSVEVTAEAKPSLIVSRPDGALDVYDAATGAFLREIAQVAVAPLTLIAAR